MHIALPTLACTLFGDTVKVDVYIETFFETVSTVEQKVLEMHEAVKTFSLEQIERLTAILSRFGYS